MMYVTATLLGLLRCRAVVCSCEYCACLRRTDHRVLSLVRPTPVFTAARWRELSFSSVLQSLRANSAHSCRTIYRTRAAAPGTRAVTLQPQPSPPVGEHTA
jgi:hypothetical protein